MMEKFGTPKEVLNQTIAELQKADNYSLENITISKEHSDTNFSTVSWKL